MRISFHIELDWHPRLLETISTMPQGGYKRKFGSYDEVEIEEREVEIEIEREGEREREIEIQESKDSKKSFSYHAKSSNSNSNSKKMLQELDRLLKQENNKL